jgi:hypothetical protein
MEALIFVGLWLLAGFVFSIAIGRFGAYDYYPTGGQVSPGFFKYAVLIIWPFIALGLLFDAVGGFFRWVDRLYNRIAKVR